MAKQWTYSQYWKRVEEIENKYEPILCAYYAYASQRSDQERLEQRFSKLMQRVDGLRSAFEMLHVQRKREAAIAILEHQVAEPTVQFLPYFVEAVQMVLNDLKTDVVAPLTTSMLQIA